ncbi:MAG: conserved membrane protein of unknown function [Candidatus Thorarchaeota archaeon]|nr:MAG: conserved membrane protein of unknown function [Candidatus Thorarchaeota archaeon]
MKVVTWVLRILSIVTFVYMAYLVYSIMSVLGVWDWSAPYDYIVTVFRLLSLLVFFVSITVFSGILAAALGVIPGGLTSGLYNSLILRLWYLQPYGVSGPYTDVNVAFSQFLGNIFQILDYLYNTSFIFLYFLCAGVGIALFLQSLVRMEHKYVAGAFISIQAILVIGAYAPMISVIDINPVPNDLIAFIFHSGQILALVSFAYLEISYQMIYSYSVGKPVEDREETLKKQLLALRTATRKQDAIDKGESLASSAMSRSSGATVFSFVREAIERKTLGEKDELENLDAISDVRRLQIFVDELLASDPNARDELTAKAAAPSSFYVISSTIMGSAIRFISVIALSFLLINPEFFMSLLNLTPGIQNSAELTQPEIILLFMVPLLLLFPFVAMVISSFVSQEEDVKEELSPEEKEAEKERKRKLKKMKKDAAKARKEREKAKRRKRTDSGDEIDEWDRALEETYGV